MSFLDHIARCNTHDLMKFVPLIVDGSIAGRVRRDHLAHLERFPEVFTLGQDNVHLAGDLCGYWDRTEAVDIVVRTLFEQGLLPYLQNEPYPVGGNWGGPHAFEIERAAVAFFGIPAYGVHINGFVGAGRGLKLWIGVRADERSVCPGELDNMIAGGQPVTLSLKENVVKEAREEAGVLPQLANTAIPTSTITYVMENEIGLRQNTMFCWDLALPPDFKPVNSDGEISEFRLLPVKTVMQIVDTGFEFKFNCNLVIIDFLIRHGFLSSEHPDYEMILQGLRR